jgi:hypothetical protein
MFFLEKVWLYGRDGTQQCISVYPFEARSSSVQYLRFQSLPQRKHSTLPLQKLTG